MTVSAKDNNQVKTVWLIEDNISYRESIGLIIDNTPGYLCERQFSSWEKGKEALADSRPPDIILSDIGLPGMNGIKGVAYARKEIPGIPIIMLTVHDDDDKVFDAICAGASGYLLKSGTEVEITEALDQVFSGGSPMNPHIARKVLDMFSNMHNPDQQYDLTDREQEVLTHIVDGTTKKATALKLDISFHTVDMHVRRIYEKLQVNCRSDAVAKAIREKLV